MQVQASKGMWGGGPMGLPHKESHLAAHQVVLLQKE